MQYTLINSNGIILSHVEGYEPPQTVIDYYLDQGYTEVDVQESDEYEFDIKVICSEDGYSMYFNVFTNR